MPDQLDAFMRLKADDFGIDGESTDIEFAGKNVFELVSFSISPENQTLTLKKPSDKATALLHQKYCMNFGKDATKKWIKAGRLWVRKDCGNTTVSDVSGKNVVSAAYLVYDFKRLSVKKFDWSVSDSGVSEDDVTLSFEGLLVKYRPQKSDGSFGSYLQAAWNFSAKDKTAMTEWTNGDIF